MDLRREPPVPLLSSLKAPLLDLLQDPVVQKSLSCLKASIANDGLANIYTTTLMAYVFTLAGDLATRGRLLDHLSTKAKSKGGSVSSWTRVDLGTSGTQLLCVCRRFAVLGTDVGGRLALSGSGDQRVQGSSPAQREPHPGGPGLRHPHHQVDLNPAELLRRLLQHPGRCGGSGPAGRSPQASGSVCRTRWWPSRPWLSAPG